MSKINLPTDHDILNTLVADVRNMKEGQDKFHQEMKDSFRELKDNYASRLEYVERSLNDSSKVFAAKEGQDRVNSKFDRRISWLERIGYGGLAILGCVEFYFQFIRK